MAHISTPRHPRRVLLDLLALSAGLLTVLAFAPYAFTPLAVVGPAMLFFSWFKASPGRMAWRGYLYGLGLFGFGVSWVTAGLGQFGPNMQILAWPLAGVFVLVLAIYPAVMGFVASRFEGLPQGIRLVLIWPVLWTAFEWLRGTLFTGFPWLILGDSQVASGPGGLAPIVGDYGVSFWVVMLSGFLCLALVAPRLPVRAVALLIIPLGWFGAGVLRDINWTHPVGAPMQVSAVQGDVAQEVKWSPTKFDQTLSRYRQLTQMYWHSRLIVWPETAIPALYQRVAKGYLDPLAAQARRHGTDLIIGLFVRRQSRTYNAVVSLGAGPPSFYFKHHLVPFGEYMPFKGVLGGLYHALGVPIAGLSAGQGGYTVRADGRRADVTICYEDAYGDLVIRGLPQASLLVNVSDDAWFDHSLELAQHMQMARMRALETGRYLVRAANTGISGIIGPKGQVIARSQEGRVTVVTARIRPMGGTTPYIRFGNRPIVAFVFTAWIAGWAVSRLRIQSQKKDTT